MSDVPVGVSIETTAPATGAPASRVWGQGGGFSSAVANLGGLSAMSLKAPAGVRRFEVVKVEYK